MTGLSCIWGLGLADVAKGHGNKDGNKLRPPGP
jgi:hypothetical protein